MTETLNKLMADTRDWFARARDAGWLSTHDVERLERVEAGSPQDLFKDAQMRPLVVALFGGTGVGKSSLLNRLAGEEIARTGVERPTSRDITLYLHQDVELAALPSELPLDQVHVRRHAIADRRDVLWIDMPDIDSTVEENRALALACLPHIDLLVYVGSPERYRDDVGWRVLRERGHRHGWMFVLNRWDEGDAAQRDDFRRLLTEAGFADPVLFTTCCMPARERLRGRDEFDAVETTIRTLLAEHGLHELERLGQRARVDELRGVLADARRRLGDEDDWEQARGAWRRVWAQTREGLTTGMEWPFRMAAGRFAVREQGLLHRAVQTTAQAAKEALTGSNPPARTPAPPKAGPPIADAARMPESSEPSEATEVGKLLWDEWTGDKLAESLDGLEVALRRGRLAVAPIRAELDPVAAAAAPVVLTVVQTHLREALARPGTWLQRQIGRLMRLLYKLLPVFALLWVAYGLVAGYLRASMGHAAYPGTPFAVSSVLLVLVAWALPFTIERLIRPSLEEAALRALRRGWAAGLDALDARLEDALERAARDAGELRDDVQRIDRDMAQICGSAGAARSSAVAKLVPEQPTSR